MRQHRIVGSQPHGASQMSQSQAFAASQPTLTALSQRMPPPPLYTTQAASQSCAAVSPPSQRGTTRYEVPLSLQRSHLQFPPPPLPPPSLEQRHTTAAASVDGAVRTEHMEAQTRALLALTDALTSSRRDAAAQHDEQMHERQRAHDAQQQVASALNACVAALHAVQGTLSSELPSLRATISRRVQSAPTAEAAAALPQEKHGSAVVPKRAVPHPFRAVGPLRTAPSQPLGVNRVCLLGASGGHQSTLSASASSPQLFPEPGALQRGLKRTAPVVTQAGPVKNSRLEGTRVAAEIPARTPRTLTRQPGASPTSQESSAADVVGDATAAGAALCSFFDESDGDGVYLL